jgi:hypothetical protein
MSSWLRSWWRTAAALAVTIHSAMNSSTTHGILGSGMIFLHHLFDIVLPTEYVSCMFPEVTYEYFAAVFYFTRRVTLNVL